MIKLPFFKKKEKIDDKKSVEDLKSMGADKEIKIPHKSSGIKDKEILSEHIKQKKDIFGKGVLTREELFKILESEMSTKKWEGNNPFKTREDYYFTFFDEQMNLLKKSVPFEEITISTRRFLINKEFQGGEIIIRYLFPYPELEINLADEMKNRENTKKQLERINKYILYVNNKISEGKSEYRLLDLEDLKYEKVRLTKILHSIKYGKTALFKFQDPSNLRKHFWVRQINGEYRYLKVTENDYIVEENSVTMVRGNQIINHVQEITNLRKNLNLKGILMGIGIFIAVCLLMIGLFRLLTFDEVLFDKRVKDAIDGANEKYTKEIEFLRGELKSLSPSRYSNAYSEDGGGVPSYQEVK